jgi:glycosyltransferase involved in cell wall biosynthesis
MPRVSVIIPAYNHARFITDAVDSVLRQSFRDFEIIVINDGSPDDTEAVLRPYIETGKIIYHLQRNAGVAAARNTGIAMANGDFVALLDDDDTWPEDKLEWQVRCLDGTDAVLVGGACDTGKPTRRKTQLAEDSYQTLETADFFQGNPFGSPGQTLIRRSALERAGGFDPEIWGVDDLDLWIRLSRIGGMRKYGRNALFYRVHDSNASLNLPRMADNLRKVVFKNVPLASPGERSRLDRLGHRYLFKYAGKKLIWRSGALVLEGRFRAAARALSDAFRFLGGRHFKDPYLFGALVLAVVKTPFKLKVASAWCAPEKIQ